MFEFQIGNEIDPSRYAAADNAAVLVVEGEGLRDCRGPTPRSAQRCGRRAALRRAGGLGDRSSHRDIAQIRWHVPVRPAATPLRLFDRLASKLVLNTVSTATMCRLGRVSSNWMVYVEATNKKFVNRSTGPWWPNYGGRWI